MVTALRNIRHIVSTEALKLSYFALAHSVISYGIIFGAVQPMYIKYSYCRKELLESLPTLNLESHAGRFLR
jgi:hypothetical protein